MVKRMNALGDCLILLMSSMEQSRRLLEILQGSCCNEIAPYSYFIDCRRVDIIHDLTRSGVSQLNNSSSCTDSVQQQTRRDDFTTKPLTTMLRCVNILTCILER